MTPELTKTNAFRPADDSPLDARTGGSRVVPGGDRVELAAAERLRTDGRAVTGVDEACGADGLPGVPGRPVDLERLAAAGDDPRCVATVPSETVTERS